jgi:hypothetical protein
VSNSTRSRKRTPNYDAVAHLYAEAAFGGLPPIPWVTIRVSNKWIALISGHLRPDFSKLRPEEISEIKGRISEAGFQVLGSATYPDSDLAVSHFCVVLVEGGEKDLPALGALQSEVVHRILARREGGGA